MRRDGEGSHVVRARPLASLAGAMIRNRFAFAPAAVGIAIGAALLVEHERHRPGSTAPPLASWILFALAAAALALAAGDARRLLPADVALRSGAPGRAGRLALGSLALAVLAAAASVPLFVSLNRANPPDTPDWLVNNGSWLLYGVSILCFGLAVVLWEGKARGTGSGRLTREGRLAWRVETPMVGALFAGALVLRLVRLDSIPPGLWFDEAQNGLSAESLVHSSAIHAVFIPGLTQMGAPYFYALGALLHATGPEVWTVRLLPALAGAVTVPLLYLLASRLYGWRVGLVSAGLLATSAWNITFSRLGFVSMWTAALNLAVYLCVVQGLRTGRLRWYAAAGAALGLALQGYYIAELVPLVLLALTLHLVLTERRSLRRGWAGAAALAAGALLASLPALLYALQRPDDYWERVRTVRISATTPGDQLHALLTNSHIHLLMFNFRGETNTRQNLAGAPVLDWLTAGLFFAGLAYCILRLGRWHYFLPAVWFLAALSAGVGTSVEGAPHSGRTLENSIVTALLAGIFLGEAWRIAGRAARGRGPALVLTAVAALGAVGAAAAMNVHRYFGLQATDRETWTSMLAGNAFAGRVLARYSASRDVWLSDLFYGPYGYSTVAFLAPKGGGLRWTGMERFPLIGPRPAIVALDPGAATDLAAFALAYPRARFSALVPTGRDREPLAYAVFVPSADLRAAHGLAAVGHGRSRALVTTLKLDAGGRYRFAWNTGGRRTSVRVDGHRTSAGSALFLAAGLHRVEVSPPSRGRLVWARAGRPWSTVPPARLFDPQRVPVRGLLGRYRIGAGFAGPVARSRIDRDIAFDDIVDRVPEPHTVEWVGDVYAPVTGRYSFAVAAVGWARLLLDGRTVVVAHDLSGENSIRLGRGWHDLHLRYLARNGLVTIRLLWAPPGPSPTTVPSAFLRPPGTAGAPAFLPGIGLADGSRVPPGRLAVTSDLTRAP
jgi:4-amino-4-deoxy-L-arabinose transferase-like glycosyltransferase